MRIGMAIFSGLIGKQSVKTCNQVMLRIQSDWIQESDPRNRFCNLYDFLFTQIPKTKFDFEICDTQIRNLHLRCIRFSLREE